MEWNDIRAEPEIFPAAGKLDRPTTITERLRSWSAALCAAFGEGRRWQASGPQDPERTTNVDRPTTIIERLRSWSEGLSLLKALSLWNGSKGAPLSERGEGGKLAARKTPASPSIAPWF